MRLKRYIRIPVILFFLFAILAIAAENYVLKGGIKKFDINRFSKSMHKKELKTSDVLNTTSLFLSQNNQFSTDSLLIFLDKNKKQLTADDISLIVTKGDELVYWTNHVAAFHNEIKNAEEGLIHLPNGWYILRRHQHFDYSVIGLILIKYDYKIQNNYLQNNYASGFHMPSDYEIHFYPSNDTYPIYDIENRYLFSINPSGYLPCIYSDLYLPVALYALALLMLFMSIYRIVNHYYHKHKKLKLLLLFMFLSLLYAAMAHTHVPRSLYELNLFSPMHFAYSMVWSSMGELLVSGLFFFYWGLVFARLFYLPDKIKNKKGYRIFALSSGLVVLAMLFVLVRQIMFILIMNSGVSFAIYRIGDISVFSFPGFLSIGLLYFGFFFIAFSFVKAFRKHVSLKSYIILLSLITLAVSAFLHYSGLAENLRLSFFFWAVMLSMFYAIQNNNIRHRLSVIVLLSVIFSLFSLTILVQFNEKHESRIQELMAINLSAEHDPSAELFLRDIDMQLTNDTIIYELLMPPYDMAENFIAGKYFGGYFREYELQQTFCHSTDSLIIQPGNLFKPCSDFFNDLIDEYGSKIPGTNFYFLNNLNGRITYFGVFEFHFEEYDETVSLYLELNSRLISEGSGFPELLMPAQSAENRLRNNFSYAKYNNYELVDRSGKFLYALNPETYTIPQGKSLYFFNAENHVHFAYTLGDGSHIVVSRKQISIYDYLIAFPYIFVFLFVMSLTVNYITRPYMQFLSLTGSLRMRIQTSIIGVVFFALLVVGSGTVYYSINQYRTNHSNDLIDKINSVSVEMDILLRETEGFDNQLVDYLRFELLTLSEIFWTDINIYDLDGKLLATSRPEVFEKGLVSDRMDIRALRYMQNNKPARYLHNEHIAKMEFLSAYVPLINFSGDIIGYLNIPYFTKQREFRKQITTFIVAFINIYVFLLLASILVAYYISARISEPLRLITENLREVQLGKSSKPIEYKANDEIGLLVNEYNSKVEELAVRAEQLARSERETAWREMAKQIAHEIKNPLTPMKLNIQFLQRTSLENPNDFIDKVKKVSETLIEQIDNLSAIATEFSNFAKIPRAKNEVFNLSKRLLETLKLYNYTGQIEIKTFFPENQVFEVYADPEQFSRAIINLIKNAIQAIPEEKKGKIEMAIIKDAKSAIISISDNGKGIPGNLKESIFVPNFTTKTSGAGLGLAITRNIVENFNGEIWFETKENQGSTFFIRIPLCRKL